MFVVETLAGGRLNSFSNIVRPTKTAYVAIFAH